MENFNFWLTLATATIPAAITGFLSFSASWMKNRSDLKRLREQFKHDMEKMEKNHSQELEKMKAAHQLELENIQKQSEVEVNTVVAKGLMDMLGTAMGPALAKQLENTDLLNQPEK